MTDAATTTDAPTRTVGRLARVRGALRRIGGRLPGSAATWLAAVVVCVLSWPVASLDPGIDLDQSFRTGLHMVAHYRLDSGPEVVSTYGPLGFLHDPVLAYPWTTRLAFAYTLLVHLALSGALIWALRRHWGLLLGALIAVLFAALPFQEPVPIIAFIGAVALLTGRLPARNPERLLAAGGALAGLELLAKLNTGVTILLLGLVVIAAWPGRRRTAAAWFAGGLVAVTAAGWLLAGQSVTALPQYVSRSLAVIGGYSEAMGLDEPGHAWEIWAAGAFCALGLAFAWWSAPAGDTRRRLGLAAAWLVVSLTAYKSGFVRHSPGHTSIFFSTIICCLPAFARPPQGRLTAALALGMPLVAQFGSLGWGPQNYVQPKARPQALVHEARMLLPGGGTRDHIAAARNNVLAAFQVDQGSLDAIGTRSVHVDPVDALVAWAAELQWRPEPVFQAYGAYTAALDRVNADALAGPRAPDRILSHVFTPLDFRNRAWESPAEKVALLCRYRALHTSGGWQVLGRAGDRCGPPREIGRVETTWGRQVAIPPAPDAHSLVSMRMEGVEVAGSEKLRTMAFRAYPRALNYDDGRAFRLVPGTTANEMILRVPAAADFPAPFALDQAARSFLLTRGSGRHPAGGRITVRFYARPIR